MKIKVKALALELNISDNTLIHWLSRKGYSGARGQDWLTAHLARRARAELQTRSSHPALGEQRQFLSAGLISPELKKSLEASIESQSVTQRSTTISESSTQQSHPLTPKSERTPQLSDHSTRGGEAEDASLISRERARADLLLKRLEEQKAYHEERYHELRKRYEHTIGERTQLRQTLYSMGQNQETLDQTCRELSQDLEQTRREVSELKRDLKAQDKMSTAIDQVTQQKQAWRAKALALEERVQTNQQLSAQLKELGMDSLELQIRLFQTLLATPESASQLFHAIKMVEHDEVRQMVSRWVVSTCAHPLCEQVNQLGRKLSLRVDRASQCQVCAGDQERRWFKRMTASCELAHVRRFLLVGAEGIHERLREFTEGKAIDFRLISSRDESSDQRILSRLENCDLLLSWPHESQDEVGAGARYRGLAPTAGAPSLELPGDRADLSQLSRFILNWVNRTGGHP